MCNINTFIQQLCDNILLKIFSHWSVNDLYAVAKCNHRFTFIKNRVGDYRIINPAKASAWKSADMLRIFGPAIRKFRIKNFAEYCSESCQLLFFCITSSIVILSLLITITDKLFIYNIPYFFSLSESKGFHIHIHTYL